MKRVSTPLLVVVTIVCMLSEFCCCGKNEKINSNKKSASLPELKSILKEEKVLNFRKTVSGFLPKIKSEPANESSRDRKKPKKRNVRRPPGTKNFEKYTKLAKKEEEKKIAQIEKNGPLPRNSSPYTCMANLCNKSIIT